MEANEPVNAWILNPVVAAVLFVGEEAKIGGLLQRALAHIEKGQPLLEMAARHLASVRNVKGVQAIQHLLADAPLQGQWAAELRSGDYAVLNGHSLVAIWGALETCVDDTIAAILKVDPSCSQRLATVGIRVPEHSVYAEDEEEMRRLIAKIKSAKAVRVDHDVVETQDRFLELFELTARCPEHKNALLVANSLRNALMHRGGIIDAKAVKQAPDLAGMLGQRCLISRDLYLACHKAISACLVALTASIACSKYVKGSSR